MQHWYFMLEYDLCLITIIICINYNVLIIVIHDCMYVRNIVNIISFIKRH